MLTTAAFDLGEEKGNATASATSAAAQVLRLPELVSAIPAHIQPTESYFSNSADDGDDDHDHFEPLDYDADAAAAERAPARAVLRAAVLVNRAWYAAGVPLL